MSYPDLGCFAECLSCELCGGDKPINLFPSWDDMDEIFGPDWADPDWGPEPAENDFDLDVPTGIEGDWGDIHWEISPTWDPWGFEIKGTF
jgi:hypothetical protein